MAGRLVVVEVTTYEHKYSQLWRTAEATLTATVSDLTTRFGGGTAFFDALDERMRDPLYYEALISKAFDEFPEGTHIVVSGRFGQAFAPWLLHSEWGLFYPPALVVPGNLRHSELRPFWHRLGNRFPASRVLSDYALAGGSANILGEINDHRFIFLDDSAYRFRTSNQIGRRIVEANAEMVGHVVLYDGSREPRRIPSFYRFHPDAGYQE